MSLRSACVAATVLCIAFGSIGIARGHAQTGSMSTPPLSSAPALTASDLARNERLRAASEPFETLTEISFDPDVAAIDKIISLAQKSIMGLGDALSGEAAMHVGQLLSAVRAAREKMNRVALALSSIEIYRILISAAAPGSKVPNEVFLLDYAGFRCNADLKAVPVRWKDMAQTVRFARMIWTQLPPKETAPVSTKFNTALAELEHSIAQQNAPKAAVAIKAELDLVDELESLFAAH